MPPIACSVVRYGCTGSHSRSSWSCSGPFGGRVHRVANAVAVRSPSRSSEELRAQLDLGAVDTPVLLYAGRLELIRGPDVLLDAFATVLECHPGAILLMAGAGSAEPLLRQEGDRAALGDRVRFLGTRRDVRDLMVLADLFVIPSRGEGMPTVLLEALACGCPVVATAVGVIPEATRGGALADLVPPGTARELSASCVRLLDDPIRRSQMAALGVAEISARYSPKRAAEGTDAVYAAAMRELGHRTHANS